MVNKTDELQSRLVFIDTSIFESKNFQFDRNELLEISRHVKDDFIRLLMPDITISEIRNHIENHSSDCIRILKKARKDLRIIRNTPGLSVHGIFDEIEASEIREILIGKFDAFLDQENVELLRYKNVNVEEVFKSYFEGEPPFSGGTKKSEFPDAFALSQVDEISRKRDRTVYILSSDGDMKSYCEKKDNLIWLDGLDRLIDMSLRNIQELEEPAIFSDSIFDLFSEEIVVDLSDILASSEYYAKGVLDLFEEVSFQEIESLKIENKSILKLDDERSEYEVNFNAIFKTKYIRPDYDRSPWDSEECDYLFLLFNESIQKHEVSISARVYLTFADSLKANAEIEFIELVEDYIELDMGAAEELEFKELDINGE